MNECQMLNTLPIHSNGLLLIVTFSSPLALTSCGNSLVSLWVRHILQLMAKKQVSFSNLCGLLITIQEDIDFYMLINQMFTLLPSIPTKPYKIRMWFIHRKEK